MRLSPEQERACEAVLAGHNIFLTGSAGTGKSATLKYIITALHAKYRNQPGAVAVVAPTAAAAIQVEGTTIHSWSGLSQVTRATAPTLYKWNRAAWQRAVVLVMDEVSMVSDWLLDLLNRMGQESRNCKNPFGGVQLVLCGDFLQLPPVEGGYCFQSAAWTSAIQHCYELHYAYRQGQDHEFATLLADVRIGRNTDEIRRSLLTGPFPSLSDIEPTRLYSKRAQVGAENTDRLQQLPGETIVHTAEDSGPEWALKKVSSWSNAVQRLELKVGAQVVLLKNLDIERGLVNGALGLVVGFDTGNAPVVRFTCNLTRTMERAKWTLTVADRPNAEVATRWQYPLDLAWAITIHRSQGMSLDRVSTDLSECFAPGQAYVALSRCRTRQGLTVLGMSATSIKADPRAVAFHLSIAKEEEEETLAGPTKRHKGE